MPPELIDTHAHLDFDEYDGDRDEVIRRSREAGVVHILNAGNQLSRTQQLLDLFADSDYVSVALGVHPYHADEFSDDDLEAFRAFAEDPRIVAIGEIGLDYFKNKIPRERQLDVFERQLAVALEVGKPVIIHSRDAAADTLAVLNRHRPESGYRGVQHCFTNTADYAREVLALGLHISFTGIVTFPKTDALQEIVKLVPADRLLLETDCPFLAPQAVRGKRNEPAYVAHTAEAIAALRGVSFDEIARTTTENAMRLFGFRGME